MRSALRRGLTATALTAVVLSTGACDKKETPPPAAGQDPAAAAAAVAAAANDGVEKAKEMAANAGDKVAAAGAKVVEAGQNAAGAVADNVNDVAAKVAGAGEALAVAVGANPANPSEVKMTTDTPADVAAPPADAQKTASGLAYKLIGKVDGSKKPKEWDTVSVHYVGWTTDGKKFDSSLDRGQPTSFPLNRVIAGWTEGVQLIGIGEHARFWIPENLAYQGQPGAPAGMLVFDVELLSITDGQAPVSAPADVAAAPADAKKTASGLAWKVIKAAPAGEKPKETSTVEVHYTGWTTDGKMFDSSVQRGQTAKFPLNRVIAGWTEGLQLMDVGQTARFWIPEALAYKGQPGRPAGMLVFDVELISVNN